MKPTLQHYRQIDIIRQAENAFFQKQVLSRLIYLIGIQEKFIKKN